MKYYALSEDKDLLFLEGSLDQVNRYLQREFPNTNFQIHEVDDGIYTKLKDNKKEAVEKIKTNFSCLL
jgi:disulfide oxidoreductase YuzD